MERRYKPGEFAELVNRTVATLRIWDKTGAGSIYLLVKPNEIRSSAQFVENGEAQVLHIAETEKQQEQIEERAVVHYH